MIAPAYQVFDGFEIPWGTDTKNQMRDTGINVAFAGFITVFGIGTALATKFGRRERDIGREAIPVTDQTGAADLDAPAARPHGAGAPAVFAFWHEFLPLMPA